MSLKLSLTFHAQSYLMTTDLCQWYMEQGVEISNVTLVVEYIKYQPFKKFINELAECRKIADQNGQSDLAAIFKLLANATYGSLALDRSKVSQLLCFKPELIFQHRNVTYKSIKDKNIKIKQDEEMQLVTGEFSADVYEIVSKKKTITDDSAIVYANTVLMNSKLHILKFIEMVVTYWNTSAIRLLYTG